MKHYRVLPAIIIALVIIAFRGFAGRAAEAQETAAPPQPRPVSARAVGFGLSPAVRDLPPAKETAIDYDLLHASAVEKNPQNAERIKPNLKGDTSPFVDPALAPAANFPAVVPTPAVSFDGLSGADNAGGVAPPDTVGDVGPNHYVQMTNLLVRIYSKDGTPLVAPFRLSSLTSVAGGPCAGVDDGDPVVNYDPLADRWILTQFCVSVVPGHQVFAVSQTPDPTGAYYVYDFVHPNNNFHDYEKIGVWPDGYFMSVNQFAPGPGAFVGGGAFAYDRRKMLAGDPTASYVFFDLSPFCPTCGGQLPSDLDGFMPPAPGAPNLFIEQRPDEFGDPFDGLRIFAFNANFANPFASTFAQVGGGDLPLAPYDGRAPGGRSHIEQPGTTTGLDSLFGPLMFKLSYRNLGSVANPVNSYVLNFTVNVSGVNPTSAATFQAGIRWVELRRDAAGAVSVFQQGTQAANPGNGAGGRNLWMGSVAQDNQGNMLLGYSTSGSEASDFPSLRYAGRLAADPPGQLAQGEAAGHLGTGFQPTVNRWGDYSAMNVDPADDCSFWYTQEYRDAARNAQSTNWNTRVIGGIRFPGCAAPPRGNVSGTITGCTSGQPVSGVAVSAGNGFFRATAANGAYSMTNLPPGAYAVSGAKAGFNPATQNATVNAGSTTTVNFCLPEAPAPTAATATIISESCAPANNALDPGETVTMAFAVQNTGLAATQSLTGALQNTGGITNAGPAQNYGSIAPNATASRNFTFTVSPDLACGAPVTAILAAVDGNVNYGNFTFSLAVGAPGATTTTFSYAGPAVAIPDNNPTGVSVPLVVSGFNTGLADLDFRIDGTVSSADPASATVGLNHPTIGDVRFRLTSPNGTTVTIMERGGGSPDCTANNFHQMRLNDEAANALQCPGGGTNGGPLAGNFRPSNPLSAFDNQIPNGVWTLNVADVSAFGLTGSLRAFSLILTPRVCCGQAPAATVQFNAPSFNATEGNAANVTVTRAGNTAGPATVEYFTANDTQVVSCADASASASSRCDFTASSGTLSFAAGETSKIVSIPIIDDLYSETDETVNLTLINPTGAGLGANGTAAVTIQDNDTIAGATRVFVARLDAAQEVPSNNSTATGFGTVTLNDAETQITANLSFSGLSSAQTAAHIHGSAPVGINAPVLFNLGTGQVTNATFAVTPAQVAQMRAGMFYFNVHTQNFMGGEIRGQIVSQPLENARLFVRQQYADFLSREPDAAGFDFWTGQIAQVCGADLACTRQRRVDVSNAFFFEQEFQQTGAYVYRLYRAAYGNAQPFPNPNTPALPNHTVFVADRARVVGSASLPAAQLALANAFVQRPEFVARFPASRTAEQFVDGLLGTIQAATNVSLAAQRDALIALHNTDGRGAVLYRLADDNAANPINNRAFIDAEYNRAFVLTQYYGYLRRDADLGGFNFWLGLVNRFPLRSPVGQNGMVCAFITSAEYQQRFSAAVTRANSECPPIP
jgi:subtilisin-like proprotein convertase family protein